MTESFDAWEVDLEARIDAASMVAERQHAEREEAAEREIDRVDNYVTLLNDPDQQET